MIRPKANENWQLNESERRKQQCTIKAVHYLKSANREHYSDNNGPRILDGMKVMAKFVSARDRYGPMLTRPPIPNIFVRPEGAKPI
jgi:hypothetical protein